LNPVQESARLVFRLRFLRVLKTSNRRRRDSSANGSVKDIRLPAPDFTKGPIPLDQILGNVEKTYLVSALEHTGGVKKRAADLLGITFRSIRYRLKKLGVDYKDPEGEADDVGDEEVESEQ